MKELLVPVGNFDCLRVAVFSGADAVYLGGKKFGARAFATNFDDENMVKAIKFCHLYGVKIYVTVNTLIHEHELKSVLEYIKFLHVNGVDAVIVQDIGLIKAIRELYPNLEIHASTQVHTTNERTIRILEELGVKRLVYAREVSIDEIDSHKTSLEKEAFIHGALCISYSGQCLASSVLLNRSGNRGECAQICRLPFKLQENGNIVETDGDYLLSTKELNTSYYFERILKSSVYSLKIEGRMKSPEYVGCVTKLYRDLLDKYYHHEPIEVNQEYYQDLITIFNRDYTKGFLFNANNSELMNIKTSNHLGTYLGNVIKIDHKYIYIKVNDDVYQGDGIRFLNSNEGGIINYLYNESYLLTNHCSKDNVLIIDNKYDVKVGDIVNKTLSIKIVKKYTEILPKKIDIDIKLFAHLNGNITLIINDKDNNIKLIGNKCVEAINRPTTKEEIEGKLNKLGNTPFKINKCTIEMDNNIFINMSEINKMRQEAISKLIELRENKNIKVKELEQSNCQIKPIKDNQISILVRTEEQLKTALKHQINRIYVTDKYLYQKYQQENVYYRSSRIGNLTNEKNILVTELGNILSGDNRILDYYLNITNHNTINYYSKYADILTLSIELNKEEITNICNYYNNETNLELIIYGTIELMLLKYCPLNMLVNKNQNCHVCLNNNKYYLVDRNDKKFRIINDFNDHSTHIMNYKPINIIEDISYYKSIGIKSYRLELLDETSKEVEILLKKVEELVYE